jgi:hypothetical protein
MTLLNETSLTATVDAVNAAFFYKAKTTKAEREAAARWIAGRQGLPGAYGEMFAMTDCDRAEGVRTFSGQAVGSGGGARHILGEEACRALRLLDVRNAGVQKALDRATAFMKARMTGPTLSRGMYCCGRCTPSVWRHILAGVPAGGPWEEFMATGLRTLKAAQLASGKWRFFPFHYTLLALSEMDSPAAVEEMRHAAPLCERTVARGAARRAPNEYARRQWLVAERVLAKC